MADLLSELESMVANTSVTEDEEVQQIDVERWQLLFGFSSQQVKEHIAQHRGNIGGLRVSDELWQLVKEEKKALGFDRESYEFSLQHVMSRRAPSTISHPQQQRHTLYILKLEVPLDSAEKVQAAASLIVPPETNKGTGETGDATFCTINGDTRRRIIEWIAQHCPTYRPTIVRLSKSAKELSSISMAPMLGKEETIMPHRRADDADFTPTPMQDQYPVWYFFYGNLARSDELQRRLNLDEPPEYVPARVRGGRIVSWRGQYRALIDAEADVSTEGSAFSVVSREHEDILRFYETEKYEVVRCEIEMEHRVQKGLVFRFAGSDDELE